MRSMILSRPNLCRLFGDIDFPTVWENEREYALPQVDIIEEEKQFRLIADLPGLKETDVTINVDDRTLTISAASDDKKEEKSDYVLRERSAHSFERRFTLADSVDTDNIEAHFAHGQLTIIAPKKAEKQPKQIAVNAA